MTRFTFAIPGDVNAPTGGYAYARAVLAEWRSAGVKVEHLPLPGGYPFPSSSDLKETARQLGGAEGVVIIDGLAFGAMPEAVIKAVRGPIVALTHHPLALETGLNAQGRALLYKSERAALTLATRVVVTSQTTAETLIADYAVSPDRLTVAEPGTERAARATGGGDIPHLAAVGTLSARKGYDVLVAALAQVSDLPWRCTIAGATDRDPATAAAVCAAIHHEGLATRIRLAGAVSEEDLGALYAGADLFVLASRYEGYGMAYAAAMARGLPIVACAGGATAQTMPREAGILVAPDDTSAFADAVRKLLTDASLRRRYSDGAWEHAQTLPSWSDTAAKIADVVREIAR
ncbi:MAG: glycosyltransferase family 4 protein [Hyphomicrobiales bacterium]|nr:glycosyltransferase family 4 protein [Hyphomicrobiales bacterium]